MKYAIARTTRVDITAGKRYQVLSTSATSFEIRDDSGDIRNPVLHHSNYKIIDMTTQEELDELKLEQIEQNESFATKQEEQDKKIARLEAKLKEDSGPIFRPKKGDGYFYIDGNGSDRSFYVRTQASSNGFCKPPQFRKESTAQGFAEAINIWFEWNMCEGRVEPSDGVQYTVSEGCRPSSWGDGNIKARFTSPCFDTEANCQASIDKIGKDRIEACRRGLHLMG